MKKKVAIIAALAMLPLAACGSNDAPEGIRDTGSADIINYPDGFSSVAYKCNGPNMVYISDNGDGSRSSAPAVVPNDPRCEVQP